MKIAMIGQRGIPVAYGGIDTCVENLSRHLAQRGHSVTVFCRRGYSEAKEYDVKGVRLKYLPCIRAKSLETLSHSLLSTICAVFGDYDVVHYHGLGSSVFSILPRIFSKRSVLTIHGLDWKAKKWNALGKLSLKFCGWASVRFPNQTIAVSKELAGYYRRRYKKIVHYVPNGAQPAGGFSSQPAHQAGDGHLFYLGRLAPQKGIHYLIEAFRGIDTDRKLIITGGSSYTDRYIRYIKNLATADKRVIFTGPLYGSEKEKVLSSAYLFILPSEIEGLSLSLLEAMAGGRCCLVSDIAENLEAIGSCGFSFRTKDTGDLKEKLEFLLARPDLVRETGRRAKLRAQEDYGWDKISEEVERLYMNKSGHFEEVKSKWKNLRS